MSNLSQDRTTTSDPREFRRMLAHYPTGVCVVTATQADGFPVGMSLGTFTSVSLNPPLIGFLPARSSTTWPIIAAIGRFCVNILSAAQVETSQIFASKSSDRFARTDFRMGQNGSPILAGSVLAVECDLHASIDAGDHLFVTGLVSAFWEEADEVPLIFHRGDYRRIAAIAG